MKTQFKFNPITGSLDLVAPTVLADDPNPTLSADLDLNGFSIVTPPGVDLPLHPGAGGNVIIDENTWPSTDGTAGQVVKTDGAGNLYWAADATGLTAASGLETQQATINTKAVTPLSLNSLTAEGKDTGFVSWGGAGVYYSVAGTTFTLSRPGVGYIKSKRVDWLGAQSTAALAAGSTYFVYVDSTGTIGSTNVFSQTLYEDYIVLFEVWVDSSGMSYVTVVKENHPYSVQTDTSVFLHRVIGTVIQNTAGGANITLVNTKELQIVGTDVLEDHGLETIIPDSTGNAITINWCYTTAAGKWGRYLQHSTTPSVYNNAGTVSALPANRYGVFRIYVSKDDLNSSTPTYYAVINTAHYASLIAARAGINTGVAAATNELAAIEVAQLGYIIYRESTDAIAEIQIQKATLRGTITGAGASNLASAISTNTATFNGALSAADTNVQNALETLDDAAYTIVTTYNASGTHTFNSRTRFVRLWLYNGGSGGGSGRRGDVNTERYGGGGGSGSTLIEYFVPITAFPNPVVLTIGAFGTGGAAQTSNNTNGNNGTAGGQTDIGSILFCNTAGSSTGSGGTAVSAIAGGATAIYINNVHFSATFAGQSGINGSNTTPANASAQSHFTFGGGGGGGLNVANSVGNGSVGRSLAKIGTTIAIRPGGNAGIAGADGGVGGDWGSANTYSWSGGMGGGGGGASKTANAGAGGKGGWPGGGGGGGGASLNGYNSGKGGDGGDGGVIIIEYL